MVLTCFDMALTIYVDALFMSTNPNAVGLA